MPDLSTSALQQALLVLQILTAVQPVMAQTSPTALSPGAAAGIAAAVSVTVCFAIGAVIVCLLTRRSGKHRPAPRTLSAIYNGGQHGNNNASGDQHHIVTFVEEGSGADTESAAVRHQLQQNSKASKSSEEVHAISVKVTSPDDLRFKICRRDGQILVATDPQHSSLCSREGIRSGDRILGVFVNLCDSPNAHPKEVCDLLTLSNDCSLVVDFEHRGAIQRSLPEPSNARQRPISAAEKALRRQCEPTVEVVDGGAGGDWQVPTPPERHYLAVRSRKLHAPPPPSTEYAIGEGHVRFEAEGGGDEEVDDVDGGLQQFCETLAEVGDTDRNGSGEGDDESLLEPEFKPKQCSSAPTWISVERIYDHYELEEQDVVAAMAPPSAQRPVVDSTTQFKGDLGRGRNSSLIDVEEAAAWIGAPVWVSLPNHSEEPVDVEPTSSSLLDHQKIGLRPPLRPSEKERRQAMLLLSDIEMENIDDTDEDRELQVPEDEETKTVEPLTDEDTRVQEPGSGDARAAELKAEDDRADDAENDKTQESEAVEMKKAVIKGGQILIVEVEREPFELGEHVVLVRSDEQEDSLPASILVEADLTLDSDREVDKQNESEEEHELANYLEDQHHQKHHIAAPNSSAPASVLTVQEEAVVEVLVPKANAAQGEANHVYHGDNSLEKLTRSMALRDLEVATVILLDSQAQREEYGEDTTEPSSGRSTAVHEESIQPREAPDRHDRTLWDQTLDRLWDIEPDVDPDVESADALNEDFELAAAEWAAKNASHPPLHPHPQPPLQEVGEEDYDDDDSFALSPERESPLLDADLVNEIVDGTKDIWTKDDGLDEAASIEGDFGLKDSELSGENLDQLLARLEDKDGGKFSNL